MFEMRAKMITVGLLGAAALLPIDQAKADQLGHASWYSLPANITANGEQMNPNELTAAHRSLPFGTRVLVENLTNGRTVVVRINDRGPFIGGRIIDLSKAAAASIGMINAGTAKVRVTTADGSVLAALGETTTKAKDGASSGAVAKVDIAPAETATAKGVAHTPAREQEEREGDGLRVSEAFRLAGEAGSRGPRPRRQEVFGPAFKWRPPKTASAPPQTRHQAWRAGASWWRQMTIPTPSSAPRRAS